MEEGEAEALLHALREKKGEEEGGKEEEDGEEDEKKKKEEEEEEGFIRKILVLRIYSLEEEEEEAEVEVFKSLRVAAMLWCLATL
jgi:hypothetical protein